ncbi:metal ABC transporter permease [Selenomonas sputigena]|uniref:ABC 3 transport family protein n=1 Tax=Selenomonas sputigena (strain ATCC 35185 / DSM 20758 / CCUG 44933 / VPI D19B-28) TaxID=546271 RepID=C9LYS9_SELS3|nr:metal ABC transporter permease [Selenomonas sputigena]AEC00952.1 ABC-type transporter, integral membrane subunit [Selenomonas sputigena ATCC 35185]EEX76029.1 ABC 3 transport family protein [Selenomonas sputigena ATCC 35185]
MELLYALLSALPFDWLQHGFMKNAFLAVLLVTPLFGLLSTMVVSNRMAFFSDSLGHGAFTGLAVGVLLGWLSPLLSLVAFSVVFALLITYIKNRSSASTDTIIGVFSSTGIALGLMLMSRGGGFNKYSSYLIGDLLSISPEEIGSLFFVFLAVVLVWALVFNSLLVLSINASFARSRGVAAFLTEGLFASVLAVVVAVSIQWVGLLIINSLLVLPAAAARNIAQDVKSYHLLSVAVALFSGVAGLLLAYYCNMAAGASIVVVAAAVFFLTLLLKPYFVR